jgi:hypothetical protein
MVADRLAQAVRERLGLGRLLPLGPAADGVWIAERAAAGVLQHACAAVAGVRLDGLRISGPSSDVRQEPVPAPPSALPHGPVRVRAECALGPHTALPGSANELRDVLTGAAPERLGLLVQAVDVHVTELLDDPPGAPGPGHAPHLPRTVEPPAAGRSGLPGVAARATAHVPGVLGLAPVLGGPLPAVRGTGDGHHLQLEIAVAENRRALDVARAAAAAARTDLSAESGGPWTVAVLITGVAV